MIAVLSCEGGGKKAECAGEGKIFLWEIAKSR
jgi:hypothetical protein